VISLLKAVLSIERDYSNVVGKLSFARFFDVASEFANATRPRVNLDS
jgi:hypothetical protein